MEPENSTTFTIGYPVVGTEQQPYLGLVSFDLTVWGIAPAQMLALHKRLEGALGARWSQELAGIIRDVVKVPATA